jgi:hypothetical protein
MFYPERARFGCIMMFQEGVYNKCSFANNIAGLEKHRGRRSVCAIHCRKGFGSYINRHLKSFTQHPGPANMVGMFM